MTAQFGEMLILDGKKQSMLTTPLGHYFILSGKESGFASTSTACWRGYVGTWEIIDERLYLLSISAEYPDGRKAKLKDLFPDYPKRVFAHWYSGTLRVPRGDMVHYVHMGYASTWEFDVRIKVERGVVTGKTVIKNELPKEAQKAKKERLV